MKKIVIVLVAVSYYFISVNIVNAENYLLLRFGFNVDEKRDEKYLVFEHYQKEWTFGTKLIAADLGRGSDLLIFNPIICYKFSDYIHLGGRYIIDSLGNESIGPTFRFVKFTEKLIFFFEGTQYFDLKGNNHKTDTSFFVYTVGPEWYIGSEILFYHYHRGSNNLNLRPIKIGYRFKNGLAPFIMYERHWDDKKPGYNTIYTGIEYKF
jgi:hypothetical protein